MFGSLLATLLVLVEFNWLTFAPLLLSRTIFAYDEPLLGDDDVQESLSTAHGDLKNNNPSLLSDVWKNGGCGVDYTIKQ